MRAFALIIAGALAVAGCTRSNEAPPTDSLLTSLPPGHVPIAPSTSESSLGVAAQALLDSGNAAFRLKEYSKSLEYYAMAANAAPKHAAPWFGTYMVGQAMGDKALADSALRMVRERSPDMQAHPGGVPGQAPGAAPGAPPASPHGGAPPLPHGSPAPVKRTTPAGGTS